jgi:hypothetical protein
MSEMVYVVHSCILPESDGLGEGSVWRCDCQKMYELVYYPSVIYYHSASIPASIGWAELAPRWWNEETQTPTPRLQRTGILLQEQTKKSVAMPKTNWQRFIALIKGENK